VSALWATGNIVTRGYVTLTPAGVVLTLTAGTPVVAQAAGGLLTPTPVTVTWTPVAPGLLMGTVRLAPEAVGVSWAVGTPFVGSASQTSAPDLPSALFTVTLRTSSLLDALLLYTSSTEILLR